MAQSFPLFSELPTEIRLQIWHSALPAHDKPSLFPWRPGCWQLRPIPPSDPTHDPAAPIFPRLEFNHELLEPLRCTALSLTPLLCVSGEARHVALAWVRQNGFDLSLGGVYSRVFNPDLDVVFLSYLIKDDEADHMMDARSVLYNEIFDHLQGTEALGAMQQEAERRRRLRSHEQQQIAPDDDAHSEAEFEGADLRKIDPWSAVARFALPARRSRSEGEWTLLPHFFPKFDTLYILAPRYGAVDEADVHNITGENMKMRRLYDLDPGRDISFMEFDGQDKFAWRGDWSRDESLLLAGREEPEFLGSFKGDVSGDAKVVDGLLVMNIEDSVNDLGSAVRNTHDKRPFRFRPVPAWWTGL